MPENISLGEKPPVQAANSKVDPAAIPAIRPGNARADPAIRARDPPNMGPVTPGQPSQPCRQSTTSIEHFGRE
jgi:hypothetical protein